MTGGNVLAFLAAPGREVSLHAISLALLRIRTTGLTYREIAKALEDFDTIWEGELFEVARRRENH